MLAVTLLDFPARRPPTVPEGAVYLAFDIKCSSKTPEGAWPCSGSTVSLLKDLEPAHAIMLFKNRADMLTSLTRRTDVLIMNSYSQTSYSSFMLFGFVRR